MKDLKEKTLALLFTRGMSLQDWDRLGNLERELKPYKYFAQFFKNIYFFTYGGTKDLEYQKLLSKNIVIVPKYFIVPSIIYSFLIPVLHLKILRRVTIVKTNQMDGSWSAVFIKWLYGSKLIIRCGYEWLNFIEKAEKAFWKRWVALIAEKFAYRNADKVILTSSDDKQFVSKRFYIPSSRIEVVSNYIDTELFKPIPVKKESGRVIFVGRLENQKNLFNMFKAIQDLPLHLVIFGTGSLKEKLQEFSEKRKLSVEFKGNVSQNQLPMELNKSELFVLPSLYEGNPKVLLEAMSCGLPCIGTNVEGISSIIIHEQNGYLCEPNPVDIQKAIKNVLGNNQLQQVMGRNARKDILRNFSLETILQKELQIYQQLI